MTKKEESCPLTPSDWVQLLMSDQDQARSIHYPEEISVLTKTVILLAITSICINLLMLVFDNFNINPTLKQWFSIALLFIFAYIVVVLIKILKRISEFKAMLESDVVDKEDKIIEDIIDGKLTDTNEIRKRYKEI